MPRTNSDKKKMSNRNRKGFITISNKEIYDSIISQNQKMDTIIDGINQRLTTVEQRVGFNNKLIIGAYSFTMTVLGFVVAWFLKG